MAFLHSFIGTWEITECRHIRTLQNTGQKLEGTRFRLDDNGDVTWTVLSEDILNLPLFSCETFELYSTSALGAVLSFGAYDGHVLRFRCNTLEPKDEIILSGESWCILYCKRIDADSDEHSIPFSLLPALEEGYFSDITITSSNKKKFQVHSSILKLQAGDIDWKSEPAPFSDLPEDVLGTLLHFLYAECLPENMTEATAHSVIKAISPHPCLNKLGKKCDLYLQKIVLKQQIIGLVDDVHASINQIIAHFSPRTTPIPSGNIASNPGKLCFIIKQSLRDACVAGVKLLLLCDLFTSRKSELTIDERNEILRYAKSRLPLFLMQLHKFLQAVKNMFSALSTSQRMVVARVLVPEIELIMEAVPALFGQIEKALLQIVQGYGHHEASKSSPNVVEMLTRSLQNLLHVREFTKIKKLHDHISCTLGMFIHKKESFKEMSPHQKTRSVARNLETLIGELPLFLLRLEEVTGAFDERIEWRDFKFCFKVGTSKLAGLVQKLVTHRDILQDIISQICELVQRDSFNQALQNLGLIDVTSTTSNLNDCLKTPSSSGSTPKHQQHNSKLNLVESLCVPPSSVSSSLSRLSLELFKTSTDADMEFEVVVAEHSENDSSSEEEKCVIKAHRVVVAARCDWFRRALLSGMREAIDKKIVIHDTSPFLFRIFLEYLYSGHLRRNCLSVEQLVELLLLSDRYEVDSLKHACEYALEKSIDLDSALDFFNMSDQYNARILKSACLNFISQHHELTESEVFFDLPIALQAEIFDCVWTQPPPKSSTMEQLLPSSVTPTSPDSSTSDTQRNNFHRSDSSSVEDIPLAQDIARLDGCISEMRNILGDSATRDMLVQVILAADYDLCRAVNFYYARNQE